MRFVAIEGERVVAHGQCQPGNLASYARPGRLVMFTATDPSDCWWDAEAETLRKKTDLESVAFSAQSVVADESDSVEVTGIPEGALVTVSGGGNEMTALHDGSPLTITASGPGTIRVRVDHARHHNFKTTLEAVEPAA